LGLGGHALTILLTTNVNFARLPPPKTTLAAILFLIGGMTCMCLGVHFYLTDRRNVEDRGTRANSIVNKYESLLITLSFFFLFSQV
jgi:hypothetical protein